MAKQKNASESKQSRQDDKISDVDSGWAWVVALAGMVTLFLGTGVYRALSMLLVELLDIYDASTTDVSLIITCVGIGVSVSALLLMFGLGDVLHERAIIATAGILTFVGFIITFFSKRVSDVYILGFFTGVGLQLGDTCSAAMLGKYFRKRLGLGSGMVHSGVSLGTVLLPLFIQWLFDEYTYRGAALVMAAVCLNSLVTGALMRPKENREADGKTVKLAQIDDLSGQRSVNSSVNNLCNEPGCLNIAYQIDEVGLNEVKNKPVLDSAVSSCAMKQHVPRQRTGFHRKSCVKFTKSFAVKQSSDKSKLSSLRKTTMFTAKFFRSPTFVFFQSFVFFSSLAVECLMQFYPQFTNELGMTRYQSAFLLSIVGVVDFIGRIFAGFLSDCNLIEPYKFAMIPQLMLGVVCYLFFLATEFWSQAILAVAIGSLHGTTYSYRPVLLVDLFGVSTVFRRAGVTSFITGLAMTAAGPLLGYIRDTTGDFKIPIRVIGGSFFASGCSLLAIGFTLFCKRKRTDRNSYRVSSEI